MDAERRVRGGREDRIVRAAELVQRPRLHPPDRPAVVLEQRPAADRDERIAEQDDQWRKWSEAEQIPLPVLSYRGPRAPQERRHADHEREQGQLDEPERDLDQHELGREHADDGDAGHVGHSELAPAAQSEQLQQAQADRQVEELQVDEADEAAAHRATRATQKGFDPSWTTSASGSPSVFGSVPTERRTVAWTGVATAMAGRR